MSLESRFKSRRVSESHDWPNVSATLVCCVLCSSPFAFAPTLEESLQASAIVYDFTCGGVCVPEEGNKRAEDEGAKQRDTDEERMVLDRLVAVLLVGISRLSRYFMFSTV